jgi:hypothetical protein
MLRYAQSVGRVARAGLGDASAVLELDWVMPMLSPRWTGDVDAVLELADASAVVD